MAYLRCIKNKDILTSEERTEYLKNKTIFINASINSSNNIVIKNKNGCLKATNSFSTKYSIVKGHNLLNTDCSFQTNSLKPAIKGNMNEANFINAIMPTGGVSGVGNSIINSETNSTNIKYEFNPTSGQFFYKDMNNQINKIDPLTPEYSVGSFSVDSFAKWDGSGVLIDGNRIYVNKEKCGPLIYLQDPSNNNYYDLSLNDGSRTDYIEMVKNNTRLTNFYLNKSINLNSYTF